MVLVDNYMVPQQQLAQEQKFHNPMYLPGNMTVNPPQQLHFHQTSDLNLNAQNANKQKMQGMMGQVIMQSDKRPEEEVKVAEPATENLNAGTQKTAEKMRKDEGKNSKNLYYFFSIQRSILFDRSWTHGYHFGGVVREHRASELKGTIPELERSLQADLKAMALSVQ